MLGWLSCDPIVEADDTFGAELPLIASPRSDGLDISSYQLSDIDIEAVFQKREADVYRLGEVDFVDMNVLSRLFDDYRVRYAGTEVVHEEPGEDFLLDRLLLPRMEICHPDGIFQPSEGCFDSPSQVVHLLHSINRKTVAVQRGHKCLIFTCIQLEPDCTQLHQILR